MPSGPDAPIVIKLGGALLDDEGALAALWPEVCRLRAERPVVIVHGGGRQMTALADRLGHTPRRVQGRRVTTDLDLKIAQWSLGGALNTELVAQAVAHECAAVGLSGADAATVQVTRRPPWTIGGETVDFGWVGDVDTVDPSLVETLLGQGLLPVVAPLGVGEQGQIYNVNADTVAAALGAALGARGLRYVTPVGGVRRRAADPATHLDICDPETVRRGVDAGWIAGGMRVKLETALDGLRNGVDRALVCGPGDLAPPTHATQITL
ncbi:MAG: acetylglutamate kinase [Salinibacter sp.]